MSDTALAIHDPAPVVVPFDGDDSPAGRLMLSLAGYITRFKDDLISGQRAHFLCDLLQAELSSYDAFEAELVRLRDEEGADVIRELGKCRWDRDQFSRLWNRVVMINRERRDRLRAIAPPSDAWRKGQSAVTAWDPIVKTGYRLGCCKCGSEHTHDFKVVLPDGGELHPDSYELQHRVY